MTVEPRDILLELGRGTDADINIRNVLRETIRALGGVAAFGRQIAEDIQALQPKDPNRIRLETAILSALGTFGSDDDEEEVDLESIQARAKALLEAEAKDT